MADGMRVDITATGLVVRPGDTLILVTHRELPVDVAVEMRERVAALMPGLAEVVIAVGMSAAVAYRPNPTDGA